MNRHASIARTVAPVLCAAALAALAGCGTLLAGAVNQTTPAVVHSSLAAVNEPRNDLLLAQILSSPEVDRAARTLVSQITGGVLDGMTDAASSARIQAMTAQYVATITHALHESLVHEISPAIQAMIHDAITSAMRAMLSESSQREMAALASTMTHSVTLAMTQGLAEGLHRDIGPALRATMRDDVGPGLAEMLSEPVNRSLAGTTRAISHQAVLGVNDGLADVEHAHPGTNAVPSVLTRLTGAAKAGIDLMAVAAVALGLAAVALVFWVRKLRAQARRAEATSTQHAATALMFAEAVRASEGKPWNAELRQMLRDRMRDDTVDGPLRDMLGKNTPDALAPDAADSAGRARPSRPDADGGGPPSRPVAVGH